MRATAPTTEVVVPHTASGRRQVELPVTPVAPIRARKPDVTELQLTPYAWAKLQYLCHCVPTEIGAMGIGLSREEPLIITDLVVPHQEVSGVCTKFDDLPFNNLLDELCDPEGKHKLHPVQCSRVWFHTHPGFSPSPSATDEETFESRWASKCSWAVMAILASDGSMYARLARNAGGLRTAHQIPIAVAWDQPFPASDHAAWLADVGQKLREVDIQSYVPAGIPCVMRDYYTEPPLSRFSDPVHDDLIFEDWEGRWTATVPDQETAVDRALSHLRSPPARRKGQEFTKVNGRPSDGSRPMIRLRPQDLLHPLDQRDRQQLWSLPPDTTTRKDSRLLKELAKIGVTPCGETARPGQKPFGRYSWLLFNVDLPLEPKLMSRIGKRWPRGLTARQLFEVSAPLDADTDNLVEVAKLEILLSNAQHHSVDQRSPSFTMQRDTHGERITELMPWVRADNTLIWLTPEEMEWMEDVIAGGSADAIPIGRFGAGRRPKPASSQWPPVPDRPVNPDFREVKDQILDIFEQLRGCIEEATIEDEWAHDVFDQNLYEKLVEPLRQGAKSGGYHSVFQWVYEELADYDHDPDAFDHELEGMLEDMKSGDRPMPGISESADRRRILESAQATLEEVNEMLMSGEDRCRQPRLTPTAGAPPS